MKRQRREKERTEKDWDVTVKGYKDKNDFVERRIRDTDPDERETKIIQIKIKNKVTDNLVQRGW